MLLPGVVLTAIFSYGPLYGIVMAFQDFNPALGFAGSPWVGLDNFRLIFSQPAFLSTIYNTFFISIMKIVCGTLASVVFALQLNEINWKPFKKTIQTVSYMPYFISLVVMCGILTDFCSTTGLFGEIQKLVNTRKTNEIFHSDAHVYPVNTGDNRVLGMAREYGGRLF